MRQTFFCGKRIDKHEFSIAGITRSILLCMLCIFIGPFSKYVTWVREKSRRKNDIEKRACCQKSDVPQTTSFMYFLLYLNLSFLVSHEALIILQPGTRKTLPRAYQCI